MWSVLSDNSAVEHDSQAGNGNRKPEKWEVTPDGLPPKIAAPRADTFEQFLYEKKLWFPDSAPDLCVLSMKADLEPKYRVYNVISGKELYRIVRNPGWNGPFVMSADGRYVAGMESGHSKTRLLVHERNGRTVKIAIGRIKDSLIQFLPGNRLLTACNSIFKSDAPDEKQIRTDGPATVTIWDLTSGNEIRRFNTPNSHFSAAAVSVGGRNLAMIANGQLLVYDISTGARAGVVNFSAGAGFARLESQKLRFSRDGSKLAGYFTQDRDDETDPLDYVLCWDVKTGKQLSNSRVQVGAYRNAVKVEGYARRKRPQWTQNDRAVILGSSIIDVASGREIWSPTAVTNSRNRKEFRLLRFCDDHSILVKHGNHLKRLDVPIGRALESQLALENNAPAHVRPGGKVSIVLNIGEIRYGRKEATEKLLRDTMARRLQALGIQVAQGQPTVLEVHYTESKGEILGVYRLNPDRFGLPSAEDFTGRTVEATKAVLKFAWLIDDHFEPVWSDASIIDPQFLFLRRDSGNRAAHEKMLENVQKKLAKLSLPYFIARQPNLSPLPLRSPLNNPAR